MPSVAYIIRRRRSRKAFKQSRRRRSALWVFLIVVLPTILALTPALLSLALALWLYAQAASTFPADPQALSLSPKHGSTQFYDRSSSVPIYTLQDPLGDQRRWISLEELPSYLVDATLVAEDRDFLRRESFDPLNSLLQIWRYMLGLPSIGETGITATLVRETLLPLARSSGLDERLLQATLLAESRRRYRAEELLEWHLNSNYYGHDAFGIEAAAQVYLGKSAAQLNLADATLLAAVASAPRHNPFEDERAARQGQTDLLFEMFNLGVIDQAAYDEASVHVSELRGNAIGSPALAKNFVLYARQQAQRILDETGHDGARMMAGGGLRITTSLDLDLYFKSECLVRSHLQRLRGGTGEMIALDGSSCAAAYELVVPAIADASTMPDRVSLALLDVGSGEILSMVGAARSQEHQPADVLQPFVYIEGFLRRTVTPASMVYDVPSVYPGSADGLIYTPTNPDNRFRGPMNLRDAMAAGLLPPAVQVANKSGMAPIIRTAHRLGYNSLDENRLDLQVLERGGGVSVLDTSYAYSVLASLGKMQGLPNQPIAAGYRGRDPVAILRIADAAGKTLWAYNRDDLSNETVIIQPSLAFMVNDILADGSARQSVLESQDELLRSSHAAAVVDGHSEDKRDSWTVGYTPEIVLAVHGERVDGAAMSLGPYERAATAPIWRALIDYLHHRGNLPQSGWPVPVDIEEFLVCEISGMLPAATDHCPTRSEIVPSGTPLRRDTLWQRFELNRVTGLLASVTTPENLREEVVFFVPPDDVLAWWTTNDKPLPPTSYDNENRGEFARAVRLTLPREYAYVGGVVEIAGSINEADADQFLLEYGDGVNPHSWVNIAAENNFDAPLEFKSRWDTAGLHGVYTLRLTSQSADGQRFLDTVQVTLDNTAPVVELLTSDGHTTISESTQGVISLLADARDNLTIERVEFYRNEELLGIDREWPYGFEYEFSGDGTLNFAAKVFDQVGNSARSELRLLVVSDS